MCFILGGGGVVVCFSFFFRFFFRELFVKFVLFGWVFGGLGGVAGFVSMSLYLQKKTVLTFKSTRKADTDKLSLNWKFTIHSEHTVLSFHFTLITLIILSYFGTCKCSNVQTNLSWTCFVFGLLSFKHPFCFTLIHELQTNLHKSSKISNTRICFGANMYLF